MKTNDQISFTYDSKKRKLTLNTQFGYEYTIDLLDTDEEPIEASLLQCKVDGQITMQCSSFSFLTQGLSYTYSDFFKITFINKNDDNNNAVNSVTFASARGDISVRRTIHSNEQKNQFIEIAPGANMLSIVYRNNFFTKLSKLLTATELLILSVDVRKKCTTCNLRAKQPYNFNYSCNIIIPFDQIIED